MVDHPRPLLVTRNWAKPGTDTNAWVNGWGYVNIICINTVPPDTTNLPCTTTEWFNPWGKPPLNTGFVKLPQPAAGAVVATLPPGVQCMDLPPRAPPRSVMLLTHTDSFKLPLQQNLPIGKQREGLPPISQRRNLPDWQDYILPWAQAPPNRQNDWPLPPRAAPRPVQDWIFTLIPPTPAPVALPLMGQIWME